jgi:nicotinamide phosphoribosyltransferase
MVLERDGCLVIRPDSGKAEQIIPDLLSSLGQAFGQTRNEKGYFVLNPKVRLIQGDGVNIESLRAILEAVKKAGYSADNIAFGSGGALLQKVDRDVQRFAFKCSAAKIDGTWRNVFKDPITDQGKKSKKGRLALVQNEDGTYETIDEADLNGRKDILETVFENGELVKEYNFEQVRQNAKI